MDEYNQAKRVINNVVDHAASEIVLFCCPIVLPAQHRDIECDAPRDEISSCDDLLRSDMYRASLWLISFFSVLGNAGSFLYRAVVRGSAAKTGFHVFVSNLCLADLLMGVYLAIVGAADVMYKGDYLSHEKLWTSGHVCKIAGVLSLLSCEVSAFIICLITLDRFLVLRFPLSVLKFRTKSAGVAVLVAWLVGLLLAVVPVLPSTSHWKFYSQTGICLPLPITRKVFPGRHYSFGLIIVFNFVLFLIIAVGQLFIYTSIRANRLTQAHSTTTASVVRNQDLSIARRLLTVVMSDFLCWFPIGLLGLLASQDVPIPGEVNVAVAIFVLPLNSALNPFLYTVNTIMEKRRRIEEAKLLRILEARLLQGSKQAK